MSGRASTAPTRSIDTQGSAARAGAIIMEVERRLGLEPTDRELDKLGFWASSNSAVTTRIASTICGVHGPREPDFGATSVNYDLSQLLRRAEPPR